MANNWIEEENSRARELARTGKTTNVSAPSLVKARKKAPSRSIKSIYIQEIHTKALDKLIFNQKMIKGKNAPELVEEAIELLLQKYGIEL